MEEKSKRKRTIKDLTYNNNNDVIETSEKATRASLEFPIRFDLSATLLAEILILCNVHVCFKSIDEF